MFFNVVDVPNYAADHSFTIDNVSLISCLNSLLFLSFIGDQVFVVTMTGEEGVSAQIKRKPYVRCAYVSNLGGPIKPSIRLTAINRELWMGEVVPYLHAIGVMWHVNFDRRPEEDDETFELWQFDDEDARNRILQLFDPSVKRRVEAGKTAQEVWKLCAAETTSE